MNTNTHPAIAAAIRDMNAAIDRGTNPNEALQFAANQAACNGAGGYADCKQLIAFLRFGVC